MGLLPATMADQQEEDCYDDDFENCYEEDFEVFLDSSRGQDAVSVNMALCVRPLDNTVAAPAAPVILLVMSAAE